MALNSSNEAVLLISGPYVDHDIVHYVYPQLNQHWLEQLEHADGVPRGRYQLPTASGLGVGSKRW